MDCPKLRTSYMSHSKIEFRLRRNQYSIWVLARSKGNYTLILNRNTNKQHFYLKQSARIRWSWSPMHTWIIPPYFQVQCYCSKMSFDSIISSHDLDVRFGVKVSSDQWESGNSRKPTQLHVLLFISAVALLGSRMEKEKLNRRRGFFIPNCLTT